MTNEIRRMTLVMILLVSLLVGFTVLSLVNPDDIFDRRSPAWNIGFVAVFLLLLYECIGLFLLRYLRRIEREPPPFARYANALIETSLPSVLIYVFSGVLTPAEALFSPPSYAYFLFILLSTLRLNFALPFFTGCVAAVEYALLVAFFFDDLNVFPEARMLSALPTHFVKIVFFLFGGVVAGLVARGLRLSFEGSFRSAEERNQIREVFGKHVSPEVVDRLLDQRDEAESETRHVCVMFLDIRDFTSFSEKRSPEEVVAYLNELFDFMIDLINQHHGIVNKFLGDGFMAIFGAPLSNGVDSHNALGAAREIIAEVNRRSGAGVIPPTRVGIGLHAGDAVTGNVGSQSRREYTIIGDTVNVAARIEALNRRFQSELLISETVHDAIQQGGLQPPACEAMEPLQVKGRVDPVRVFKVI